MVSSMGSTCIRLPYLTSGQGVTCTTSPRRTCQAPESSAPSRARRLGRGRGRRCLKEERERGQGETCLEVLAHHLVHANLGLLARVIREDDAHGVLALLSLLTAPAVKPAKCMAFLVCAQDSLPAQIWCLAAGC
jgi:hypothetical protein